MRLVMSRLDSILSVAARTASIAAVAWCLGGNAAATEESGGVERPVILHLRNGAEVSGVIVANGFDEAKGVTLRRDDNGGVLELRWDQILADDVEAIKRSYGFIGDEPPPIRIRALRLNLRGGRSIEGLDRGREGNNQVLYRKGVLTPVPIDSIESRENILVEALEVENPPEAFQRLFAEQPPKSAVDWYNFGLIAESLTLFEEAKRCFDKTLEVDPGFVKKDAIAARRKILDAKAKETDAANALRNIRTLRLQRSFAPALKLVDEFMAKWPGSSLTSDVMREQKQLAAAQYEQILNDLRTNFFPVARALCVAKALETGIELGPAMSWAEEVCFTESLKKVTKQLDLKDETETMKLWKQRGKAGSATAASYGGGTFILGADARQGLVGDDDEKKGGAAEPAAANDAGKPLTLEEKIKQKMKEKIEKAKRANEKNKTADGSDLADVPPTPEEWWTGASTRERADFLFAFFGEHAKGLDGEENVLIVESVSWRDCSVCAALGFIETYRPGAVSGGASGLERLPCPRCKKLTFDRIVRFK